MSRGVFRYGVFHRGVYLPLQLQASVYGASMVGDHFGQWWKHGRPGRDCRLGIRSRSLRKKRKGLSPFDLRSLAGNVLASCRVGESSGKEAPGGVAGSPHERKAVRLPSFFDRFTGLLARFKGAVKRSAYG